MSNVNLTIDGKTVTVPAGTSVFDAAAGIGVRIPALCHNPAMGLETVGVCRMCVVDTGGRNFAASCTRPCEEGLKVITSSQEVEAARKGLVKLLLAEHPRPCKRHQETLDCELELLGEQYGFLEPLRQSNTPGALHPSLMDHALADDYGTLTTLYSPRTRVKPPDTSNFSIAIDHGACIVCDRCVRACSDIAGHDIIGRMDKGGRTTIGFDNDKSMRDSGCVNCGWCMVACPTGAITYSGSQDGYFRDALPLESMMNLPFIRGKNVSSAFLKRGVGGVRLRQFKKGEVIFRQNERGHTAFYIDSGKVDIYLESASEPPKQRGWLERLFTGKRGEDRPEALEIGDGRMAPGKLIDQIPDGNSISSRLFGEASCRNGQPRSATIRAAEDTIAFEMLRSMLEILLLDPVFREDFANVTRYRLVHNYLRRTDLLRDLPPEELRKLEGRVSLVSFGPGQVIFERGAAPDALYIVRTGHVKVERDGVIVNTLSRGEFFGEMAVLDNVARSATCAAVDHAELVRLDSADFRDLLERFPTIREKLEAARQRHKLRDAAIRTAASRSRSVRLQQYVEQELFQGQSLMLIDLEKCTRCDECVRACAQSHHGVSRLIRDGLRFDKYLVPTSCRSCHDPKCLSGCPVDAIHRRSDGGLAIVIEDYCTGCGFCFGQDADGNNTGTGCPFGNILPVPIERTDPVSGQTYQHRKAAVCDLDNCSGETREPSCVYACPHDAAQRVNAHEFFGKHLLAADGAI